MKELSETFVLMNSSNYQDRFKAEYYQLLIRRDKLKSMLDHYKQGTLSFEPTCPIELLANQLQIMDVYLDVLCQRAEIENIQL